MPPLLASLVVNRLGLLGRPARKPVQAMLDRHFDWLDSELAARPWFAGDSFSAADVMMSFPVEAGAARADALGGRPHLAAWLKRCHDRPAYQEALKRGGPYAYA